MEDGIANVFNQHFFAKKMMPCTISKLSDQHFFVNGPERHF